MPRRRRSTPSSTGCSSIGRRWAPLVVLVAFGTTIAAAGAGSNDSGGFKVARASVAPKDAYYAARKPVTLSYLFRSRGHSRDVALRVVRAGNGDVVARWRESDLEPGTVHRRLWRAQTRDGRYRFRIGSPGHRASFSEAFAVHGHRFPVRGGHGTRGPLGDFGAPRAGGRVHEGFDVTASCGTPLLAIRAGRVERAGYDPELYGHFIEVDARESRLDYFYAHLKGPADGARGDSVKTGQRLGKVGLTGNASGTPCHLHVELRRAGRLFDPEPELVRWDRYG